MKKCILILSLLTIVAQGHSAISEGALERHRNSFLRKVIRDNPAYRGKIKACMEGLIVTGNSTIRLLDKFALFIQDSRRNGIKLKSTRFYVRGKTFSLFMVFMGKDGKAYTFFIEYRIHWRTKHVVLNDIYFSIVFERKMGAIRDFFTYR